MVFGSGNKIFRIRRSNSKASYLSSRRDRERGQPDADYGSYKRIISPPSGNHNTLDQNEKWASTNNLTKETLINNNNLLHRLSLGNTDLKPKRNLPDVLPVSAKLSPPRLERPPSPEPRLNPPPCTPPPPVTSPPHTPPVTKRASICVEKPEVEGLKLIQRTEVVLRINACTTDAASQTDRESPGGVIKTPLPTRRKLKEEIECEQLSRDLASQLSPSDKLKGILVPAPEFKKPTDYVSGLFKLEVANRSRSNAGSFSNFGTCNSSTQFSTEDLSRSYEPSSPLSATSTYFTTSEPKAKFLTRYSRDMSHYNGGVVQDTKDLNQKKEELMNRLDRKLEVLRTEHLAVNEESRVNDVLGEQVSSHVTRLARPQEVTKYRLHVEEVGKITSLLLGLSGRLARAENALMGLPNEHPERKILESKRDKLQDQLEEAKKLKENIDKRSVNVSNILFKYLDPEEYGDYDHFINMKAKLIMDGREIADKIKLGEEQLAALRETLTDIR